MPIETTQERLKRLLPQGHPMNKLAESRLDDVLRANSETVEAIATAVTAMEEPPCPAKPQTPRKQRHARKRDK